MIKYEIKNQESSVEPKLMLKLQLDLNGNVALIGKNKNGRIWHIVELLTNGRLYKHDGLPDDAGLQVDCDGRIIEEE